MRMIIKIDDVPNRVHSKQIYQQSKQNVVNNFKNTVDGYFVLL